MEENAFQRLWWKFSNAEGTATKKAILRTVAMLHVFTVAQVSVLINHFEYPSDRLEALEIMLLRIIDLSKNKDNLLTAFNYQLRDYTRAVLGTKILDAVESDRAEPLILRQLTYRGPRTIKRLQRALSQPYYTTNEWEALGGLMHAQRVGFNYEQVYKLLSAAKLEKLRLLEIVDELALGVTCREVVRILNLVPLRQRIDLLPVLANMVLDVENKWIILDHGFKGASIDLRRRVSECLEAVPWYPRSPLVGTVRSFRVVFLVDVSNSMNCVFETNQHELIPRMRLVVRDLSRVIKEQLIPGTMFNVVAFSKNATRCFPDGMRPNSPENAERACLFLRSMRAEGPTNALAAFAEAFDEDELEAIYLLTDGKPSFSHSYTVVGDKDVALQVDDVVSEIMRLRHSRGPDEQLPIHTTAVLTGVHPSDDVQGTLKFCRELADRTGGLQRCLVHKSFVLFVAEEKTRSKTAALSTPRKIVRREWKGWTYQGAIVGSFLFMNMMMLLAQYLPFNDQTCADVAAKYPTYLTPYRNAFLWYRAYVLWAAVMVAKLCLPTRTKDGILRCFRGGWVAHGILGGLWQLAFQHEMFLTSLLVAVGMLACTVQLYAALQVGQRTDSTFDEVLWVHFPVGSLMAWNSFMVMLSAAVYLKWWEWYGWGWQWEWALFLLIFLSCLAVYLLIKRKEVGFALTTVWILANVTRAHWPFVYETAEVEGGEDYSYAFPLCTACVIMASLLTFATALTVASRFSSWFTSSSSAGQRRRHLAMIALQTSNTVSFFVMIAINTVSVRWGYLLVGMDQAPLNRQTCGAIAFSGETVRIMPARFVFRLWPVVYALLLPFVFTQALPTETALPGAKDLERRDEDLGKRAMIRGTRRERLLVGLCCNKLRFALPLVHRWRLTRRSEDVVQKRIGFTFFLVNLFNIIYLVLWQFREYGWSFVVLIALFISLASLYGKVGAFRTVLTESERIVTMNEDEEADLALKRLRRLDKTKSGGAGAAAGGSSDEEGADEVKGEDGGGKAKGGARKKPKRVEEPTTPWERWAVHIPFSLYLGWVFFLMILHISFVSALNAWRTLGLANSTWAVITMAFLFLVAAGVMVVRKDPVFPLPILLALWGIFWDNSAGTCPANISDSMAGQEVVDRGFHVHWNITSEAACTAPEYSFVDGRCRHTLAEVDNPVTCARLGTRAGGFVKGYSWIDGQCVEDPGTCPYEVGKPSLDQHTPEYVVSSAALSIFIMLALATLGFGAKTFMARRGRKKAVQARWNSMMDL